MKKKIKADSVDELFEIVRAVQNGEEPEAYAKRKAEEERRKAEEENQRAREDRRKAEERQAAAEQAAREKAAACAARVKELFLRRESDEDSFEQEEEDREFESLLEDEPDDGLKKAVEMLSGRLKNMGGSVKGKNPRNTEQKIRKSRSVTKQQANPALQPEEERQVSTVKRERLAEAENAVGKTKRRYGAKSVSRDAETVGNRILRSLHMEPSGENPEEAPPPQLPHETPSSQALDETDGQSIDLDTVQILDRLLDTRDGIKNNTQDNISDVGSEKQGKIGKLSEYKETPRGPDLKNHIRRTGSWLTRKGFGKRKLAMLGVGAAVVILAFVLILSVADYMLEIQEKRKYVTSDPGLTVTVENQPEEWCSSCELLLRFSVRSGTISSIEIDGVTYNPDDAGLVTVEAQDYLLEASVETDEGAYTAEIEVPMLDVEAPVLSVEKSGGEIILTAADGRSGVDTIWYAVLDDDSWLELPEYQRYTEPISYEEGKIWYFYVSDQAGNRSIPVVTSMETAQYLTLNETDLELFPGDTAYVQAEVYPDNALLNNVSYESSNTGVVTVNRFGLVTAVAEGSALIKVSADGLETVSCTVTVSSEQTVTISAVGDCTLGSYVGVNTATSFDAYYSMYGATWFFENVRDILSGDDLTFANLEGTLTDETTPEDKTYAFKGDPSYTEILLDGSIEVVTLANNHSSDYGAQSLTDTKENLAEAGIDYCIGDTIAYQEVSGVTVAFIGIYELSTGLDCETQVRETIAEAQSEGADLIIVAFHWGTEKETAADEIQQSLAHTAIDCGADLVVGHHPHVLQGIEKYNGKYIVYSLGNFCFGGNTNPSDKDTIIFRQTFTITQSGVEDDDAIEIIPCTISSESAYNDYRPTPATGSDAEAIMERINEYSAEFGNITYTASVYS